MDNNTKWQQFRIGDIFEKIHVERIKGKAGDFPTEPDAEHTIPLLTACTSNRGFARYAKRDQCPTILKNVISVSANGENSGTAFYQPEEFAVLQDAYAIKPKNGEIKNEKCGLFLEQCINKKIKGNFSWLKKSSWNNIKDVQIMLPAKETDDIDLEYMESFINDIEAEYKEQKKQPLQRIIELYGSVGDELYD